jgi:predicted GIY-YIG superfamily endonuclease
MSKIKLPSKKSYVYIVRAGKGSRAPIKVGMTDDVNSRIKQLQTGNPLELFLVMHFECKDRTHALRLEKTIHEILQGQRLCGEWFAVSRSNIMKLFNNLGDNHKIDSLVKNMDLFDIEGKDTVKELKGKVKSRDVEIKDIKKALSIGKLKRSIYIDTLISLGVTWDEIREMRKKAREEVEKV